MELQDARRAVERAMPGTLVLHRIKDDVAICRSISHTGSDGEEINHVRVLKLRMGHEHEDQPVYADLRYEETFTDDYQAGYQFRSLEDALEEAPDMHLPDDPLESEIQKREYLEDYAQTCRAQFVEEMKEEARKLATGTTEYPPEESNLAEILNEIDALP